MSRANQCAVVGSFIVVLATGPSCKQILGIDERVYDGGGSVSGGAGASIPGGGNGGAGATTPNGGMSSSGGMTSSGGGGGGEGGAACTDDLMTDTHHCGECGHDCLGASCEQGTCNPFLLSYTPVTSHIAGIVADPGPHGEVYWVAYQAKTLYRIDKDSPGAPEFRFGGGYSLFDVVMDEKSAFVSDRNPNPTKSEGYYRIDRSEIENQLLTPSVPWAGFMALDGDFLYFMSSGAGTTTLGRVPKTGGSIASFATDNIDSHIFVEDGWIYFGGNQPISRIRTDGTGRETLWEHDGYSDVRGVHGGYVYWVENGFAQRAPTDGSGSATPLFHVDQGVFLFVGGKVYYRDYHDIRCFDEALETPAFGDTTVVVSGENPEPFTSDGVSLIWAEHFAGTIWRLAL